jgi:hypothetical protein
LWSFCDLAKNQTTIAKLSLSKSVEHTVEVSYFLFPFAFFQEFSDEQFDVSDVSARLKDRLLESI